MSSPSRDTTSTPLSLTVFLCQYLEECVEFDHFIIFASILDSPANLGRLVPAHQARFRAVSWPGGWLPGAARVCPCFFRPRRSPGRRTNPAPSGSTFTCSHVSSEIRVGSFTLELHVGVGRWTYVFQICGRRII